MFWIHHERYEFATLRGFRMRKYSRRVFISTRHHEIVIGW